MIVSPGPDTGSRFRNEHGRTRFPETGGGTAGSTRDAAIPAGIGGIRMSDTTKHRSVVRWPVH